MSKIYFKTLLLISLLIQTQTKNIENCQPQQARLTLGNSYKADSKPADENVIVVFHTLSECATAYVTLQF